MKELYGNIARVDLTSKTVKYENQILQVAGQDMV